MLFTPVLILLCLQNLLVASSPVRLLLAEVLGRHFETLPTTLESRIETIGNTDLAERDLSKRQCVASTNAKGNPIFVCDGLVVSIQDIMDKFNAKGYAAGRITMFYTALSGRTGITLSKCWANNHPSLIPPKSTTGNAAAKAGYVMFDQVCDNPWSAAVVQDYNKNQKTLGFDGDQFLKCKSQALAEQASGDVYFFAPKGVTPAAGSAWVGWEFPALMLNTNVNKVYRVDPTDPNSNDIETIWTKGDTVTGAPPQCKADGTPV